MRQPIQPYQLEILLLPTRRFDVLRIRCNLRETTPLTRRIILELVALPLSIRLNFFIRNRLDILPIPMCSARSSAPFIRRSTQLALSTSFCDNGFDHFMSRILHSDALL